MKNRSYLPELDGIRALAVSMVVLYHLGVSAFSGGFVGVDVFFVLSGYLITQKIFDQLSDGRFSFLEFYKRRLFRLFPAIIMTILLVLILGVLLFPPEPLAALAKSAVWSILSGANIHFYLQSGYWDPSGFIKPLLHFWSLSVEEQFYLVWPLLIWGVFFLAKKSRRALIGTFIVLGVTSFALTEYFLKLDPKAAFYMMPLRSWEFCIGGLLAILHDPSSKIFHHRILNSTISAAALGACLLSATMISHQTVFPGRSALITCLATALLIAFSRNSIVWPLLTNRFSTQLGKLSYSVYLVHWPLIVFYRDLKFDFLILPSPVDIPSLNHTEKVFLALVSLLSAWVMRNRIENPFRYNQFSFARARLGRSTLVCAGFLLVLLLSEVIVKTGGLPFRIDQDRYAKAISEGDAGFCVFRFKEDPWKDGCGIGVAKPEPDVILLGDSHMEHFTAGFNHLFLEMKLSGLIVAGAGTLPIPNGYSIVLGRKQAPFDETFRNLLVRRPSLVIISGRWDAHLREEIADFPGILPNRFMFGSHDSLDAASSRAAVKEGLTKMLTELNAAKIHTLVLGQVPLPVRNLKHCLSRPRYFDPFLQGCLHIDPQLQSVYHKPVMDTLLAASDSLPYVEVIDPSSELCKGNECEIYAAKDHTLLYRDGDHLSRSGGVHIVSKVIRPKIERLLPLIRDKRNANKN